MIRWNYVIPRLVMVAVFMLLLTFGLDPILRWLLVNGGQQVTKAKVEVEQISTSPLRGQFSAQGIALANPNSPGKNLFRCDYAWFDLEMAPLTRRRFVVREAVLSGLTINSDRDSLGTLDGAGDNAAGSSFGEGGKQWLEEVAKAMGKNLEEDLESVRLARTLAKQWPQEYRYLEHRIDAWLEQVRDLERLPGQLQGNVLAQAEQVRKAALTLQSLREELKDLRTEFQRLHQQARLDRSDLADASRRDVERMKARFDISRLNSDTLTDYLLGPNLGPQARETVQWIQAIRRRIPSSDLPQPQRVRGRDILFTSQHREPWLLVRSARIEGNIAWQGSSIPFAAIARDWTTQPQLHGRLETICLQTTAPVESRLELCIDRTGPGQCDQVTFSCPRLPVQTQAWGSGEHLALDVPAGEVSLHASFQVVDDNIQGEVRLHRSELSLGLHLGEQLGGAESACRVSERLKNVDQLDAVVTVSGTLDNPTTSIKSPIGEQLRIALRGAVDDELLARRSQIEAKVRGSVDREIENLQRKLSQHKSTVMKKLALADQQQKLAEHLLANTLGMPRQQLGRKILRALQER